MPYIKSENKDQVIKVGARDGGELNFAITQVLIKYFIENGGRYQQIHEISRDIETVKIGLWCTAVNTGRDGTESVLEAKLRVVLLRAGLTIADSMAALEEARAEFRRRITALYEDIKIHENGDAYPAMLLDKLHRQFANALQKTFEENGGREL